MPFRLVKLSWYQQSDLPSDGTSACESGRVVTINAARRDDTNRWLLSFQVRICTPEVWVRSRRVASNQKCRGQRAPGGDQECSEHRSYIIVFDFRPGCHGKAKLTEETSIRSMVRVTGCRPPFSIRRQAGRHQSFPPPDAHSALRFPFRFTCIQRLLNLLFRFVDNRPAAGRSSGGSSRRVVI